jgi:hypothetical protein
MKKHKKEKDFDDIINQVGATRKFAPPPVYKKKKQSKLQKFISIFTALLLVGSTLIPIVLALLSLR